jgi:hypothetical protein
MIRKEVTMGLLDLLYGKNRPPAVTAADMDAKMKALAADANRKAAEMEKAEREARALTAWTKPARRFDALAWSQSQARRIISRVSLR